MSFFLDQVASWAGYARTTDTNKTVTKNKKIKSKDNDDKSPKISESIKKHNPIPYKNSIPKPSSTSFKVKHNETKGNNTKNGKINIEYKSYINDESWWNHEYLPNDLRIKGIRLPLRFDDFDDWDSQPYHYGFIKDRFRRRINSKKYDNGYRCPSLPQPREMKAIGDILANGGNYFDLKYVYDKKRLNFEFYGNYSIIQAKPFIRAFNNMSKQEVSDMMYIYNKLRKTCLIFQPCILCGIYDIYFKQLCVSMIKRESINIINKALLGYLTKSLNYYTIHLNDNNKDNFKSIFDRETKKFIMCTNLDLIDDECIYAMIYCMSGFVKICQHCDSKHNIYKNNKNVKYKIPCDRKWIKEIMGLFKQYGLKMEREIKSYFIKYEVSLINPFNCEYIDIYQLILILLTYQPFLENSDISVLYTNDNILYCKECLKQCITDLNELKIKCIELEPLIKFTSKRKEYDDIVRLYQTYEHNIRLTIFESILKLYCYPDNIRLYLDYFIDTNQWIGLQYKRVDLFTEYDILTILLFTGHYHGYIYYYGHTKIKKKRDKEIKKKLLLLDIQSRYSFKIDGAKHDHDTIVDTIMPFRLFATFDELLTVIGWLSNIKYIGRIIAIKSLLFNVKYNKKYNKFIDNHLRFDMMDQFVQCLKILYYDYNLINLNQYNKIISQGLKECDMFKMECPYIDPYILLCLLELNIIEDVYIIKRFSNTWDFIQHEQGIQGRDVYLSLTNTILQHQNTIIVKKMDINIFHKVMQQSLDKLSENVLNSWKIENKSKFRPLMFKKQTRIMGKEFKKLFQFPIKLSKIIQDFL